MYLRYKKPNILPNDTNIITFLMTTNNKTKLAVIILLKSLWNINETWPAEEQERGLINVRYLTKQVMFKMFHLLDFSNGFCSKNTMFRLV